MKNLIKLSTIFLALILVSCSSGNNKSGISSKGVLKELPVIASDYQKKLKELDAQTQALENELMSNEDESKLMELMEKGQEVDSEIQSVSLEGKEKLTEYISNNEFNIPFELAENEYFTMEDIKVTGAVINSSESILVNLKGDVKFKKAVKIGYNGELEKLQLVAEYKNKKGEVLLTDKFYRGMENIGKQPEEGSVFTMHGNPSVIDLGNLSKIYLRLE